MKVRFINWLGSRIHFKEVEITSYNNLIGVYNNRNYAYGTKEDYERAVLLGYKFIDLKDFVNHFNNCYRTRFLYKITNGDYVTLIDYYEAYGDIREVKDNKGDVMTYQFDYHSKIKEKLFYKIVTIFKKLFKYDYKEYTEEQYHIVEFRYSFFNRIEFNYFYGSYEIKINIKKGNNENNIF